MDYTRGGRPLVKSPGNILIVEDLNMEGATGKIYSKAGKVPKGYFVYRKGQKVKITKEEYDQINSCKNQAESPKGD